MHNRNLAYKIDNKLGFLVMYSFAESLTETSKPQWRWDNTEEVGGVFCFLTLPFLGCHFK